MSGWDHVVRLGAVTRAPVNTKLVASEAERAEIAADMKVEGIGRLEAEVRVRPWMDGAEINGRIEAVVTQICGVSLDPFDEEIRTDFKLRVVPAGSPNAPEGAGEPVVDPEADDPPDVLENDDIDLGRYVLEHLALELDPFPRKPGAVFEPPEEAPRISPFDALKGLKFGKDEV